ncbi:MAG: choice-of-anchor M domain-containing protein, partial [Actinomycetaceae bacterium]|nr:choice-of-anchor M domain-containing protein [Actinomycetaceae bacterium]
MMSSPSSLKLTTKKAVHVIIVSAVVAALCAMSFVSTYSWADTGPQYPGITVSKEHKPGNLAVQERVDPHLTMPDGSPHPCAGRYLLYHAHVDSTYATYYQGKFTIMVVAGTAVVPADQVCMRVGPDANSAGVTRSHFIVTKDPALSFLGKPGSVLWYAPQDNPDFKWLPVWAGLGAFDAHHELSVPKDIKNGQVSIALDSVKGPGDVNVFNYFDDETDPDWRAIRIYSSTDPKYKSYKHFVGSHAHVGWTFSKAGIYDLNWQASATKTDDTAIETPVTPVRWLVGTDKDVGLPQGTTKRAYAITTGPRQILAMRGLHDPAGPHVDYGDGLGAGTSEPTQPGEPDKPKPDKPEDPQPEPTQPEQPAPGQPGSSSGSDVDKPTPEQPGSGAGEPPVWDKESSTNQIQKKIGETTGLMYPQIYYLRPNDKSKIAFHAASPSEKEYKSWKSGFLFPDTGLTCAAKNSDNQGFYDNTHGGWLWSSALSDDDATKAPRIIIDPKNFPNLKPGGKIIIQRATATIPSGAQAMFGRWEGLGSKRHFVPIYNSKSKTDVPMEISGDKPVAWDMVFTKPGIYDFFFFVDYEIEGRKQLGEVSFYVIVGNEAINHALSHARKGATVEGGIPNDYPLDSMKGYSCNADGAIVAPGTEGDNADSPENGSSSDGGKESDPQPGADSGPDNANTDSDNGTHPASEDGTKPDNTTEPTPGGKPEPKPEPAPKPGAEDDVKPTPGNVDTPDSGTTHELKPPVEPKPEAGDKPAPESKPESAPKPGETPEVKPVALADEIVVDKAAVLKKLQSIWKKKVPVGIVSEGHMDIGLLQKKNGQIFAALKDSARPELRLRPSGSFVVTVPSSTRRLIPTDFPGYSDFEDKARTGWYTLPQIQKPGVPWLGFSTDSVNPSQFLGDSTVYVTQKVVEAPVDARVVVGHSTLWGFAAVMDTKTGKSTYRMPLPAHDHPVMYFNKPGGYIVDYTFEFQSQDGKTRTQVIRVNYLVGDNAVSIADSLVDAGGAQPEFVDLSDVIMDGSVPKDQPVQPGKESSRPTDSGNSSKPGADSTKPAVSGGDAKPGEESVEPAGKPTAPAGKPTQSSNSGKPVKPSGKPSVPVDSPSVPKPGSDTSKPAVSGGDAKPGEEPVEPAGKPTAPAGKPTQS